MPIQSPPLSNIYSIVIPVLTIGVVLFFRVRRISVKRPLKLATLWVVSAIFLAISGMTLVQFRPRWLDLAWLAAAVPLGAALGWQRGRMMRIWVDPESGGLMTQGSGWALVLLVVLLVLRMALREGLIMEANAGDVDIGLINSAFVVFALGVFGTQRGEMALRATRLTSTGRAGRESDVTEPLQKLRRRHAPT